MAVERVGVSFEPDLLRDFDHVIRAKGYANRSEAIRDLVRSFILAERAESEEGEVVGTLTIVYDHDRSTVTSNLLHLEHHHLAEILSTLHVHLDAHACLEVLVIRGEAGRVRTLADRITALRGVKHGELVITASG
ncbi:MAG: nickel-responsive transcriptional regulator NikR [Thermoplasmatota archaeon]|nr:nickel-responsive transcriptional regulator NikR [Candidatus Thermoplasmatota archaeon]HDS59238.1 nickel-responsive transcriptional regulator NikR [Thermoplasmatales archaeon]